MWVDASAKTLWRLRLSHASARTHIHIPWSCKIGPGFYIGHLGVSQIRRFGLRNGDVIWGLIRPPREQEHYEALLRVETVNFSDPEHSRRRAVFGQLTPIFPNVRINMENSPGDWATRLVDMFAPIGLGQRALIVSPPKAGKTTLIKRIARAIATNYPDVILMALLIDERPEEMSP